MAKLSRIYQRIFGSGAGLNQISQFGSLFAGTPTFTTDPSQAQSLSNWLTGWFAAAIGGNAPAIEDMNAALFVMTYQLAYYQQSGIPEWDVSTPYYIGSLANDGTGQIYVSRTDANVGNLLTDTVNWTKIGGAVMSALGDLIYGGTNGAQTKLSGNTTAVRQFLSQTGTGTDSAAPVWTTPLAPTVQKFLSGSGTYTTPAGVLYLRVRMVGGGGGGSNGGQSAGSGGANGGDTTFGTSLLVAHGGQLAGFTSGGGAGGTASLGTGPIGIALKGGTGGGYSLSQNTLVQVAGSGGGNSALGGGGGGGATSAAGNNASPNTGGGGGGGGTSFASGAPFLSGAGGGAGGFIDAIISAPASSYPYGVGAGGSGISAGGGTAGGSGADGLLELTEFYQ